MEQVPAPRPSQWTFLTNHARVLIQIARDPGIRVRDIAAECLLTGRGPAHHRRPRTGRLPHPRSGRGSRYRVLADAKLRHPADVGPKVADLLALLTGHLPSAHCDGDTPTTPNDSR